MRILYGIQGTGNGHITRSIEVIKCLKRIGLDIDILISGHTYRLDIPWDVKYNFGGLNFKHNSDGSINKIGTLLSNNMLQFIKDSRLDLSQYDKIITDFEPITSWASKFQDRKIWGIGNQYSFLSGDLPRPSRKCHLSEFVIRWMAPVTNPVGLHYTPLDNFIVSPIIREDLINSKLSDKEHYTVYLPNTPLLVVLDKLKLSKRTKFHIFSSEVLKPLIYKNCHVRPLNNAEFLTSFTSCSGVITTGGFQTTSEALMCGKKLLVIPVKNQYEQLCNVESLKNLGVMTGELNTLDRFLLSESSIKLDFGNSMKHIIEKIIN